MFFFLTVYSRFHFIERLYNLAILQCTCVDEKWYYWRYGGERNEITKYEENESMDFKSPVTRALQGYRIQFFFIIIQ